MRKAIIFDIQRNSFVDGPGIRTTVFFKGCNLRCAWCHNPESQTQGSELLYYKEKCIGCGACQEMTPEFSCPNGAKVRCGKACSVQQLWQEIAKDRLFYDASGGGVTFSGGECMLQVDFLEEILKKSRENRVHTAVDTAGNVPWSHFERLLPHTDLWLYDLKTVDPQLHARYTGQGNGQILENLKELLACKANVWVRIPVIAGVNDSMAQMQEVKAFLDRCGKPCRVELLPYHGLGEYKYTALGREIPRFAPPGEERLRALKKIF